MLRKQWRWAVFQITEQKRENSCSLSEVCIRHKIGSIRIMLRYFSATVVYLIFETTNVASLSFGSSGQEEAGTWCHKSLVSNWWDERASFLSLTGGSVQVSYYLVENLLSCFEPWACSRTSKLSVWSAVSGQDTCCLSTVRPLFLRLNVLWAQPPQLF